MSINVLNDISHRRYNPLRGSYVLVSPKRTNRPWQGLSESPDLNELPKYDPKCYLCPTNKRASGDTNPDFKDTFVFVNDYSALMQFDESNLSPTKGADDGLASDLLQASPEKGKCYVVTFARRHDITLADMSVEQITQVVKLWTDIYAAHLSPKSSLASLTKSNFVPPLSQGENKQHQYGHMQTFVNYGEIVGCSNPHPHGQIWIQDTIPDEVEREYSQLQKYKKQKSTDMLVDYAQVEQKKKDRIVFENESFIALIPFWAMWPFETLLLPRSHKRALVDLNDTEQAQLAEVIAEVTRRYDNLFQTNFPYSMGIHQAPLEGSEEENECSSLHIHFYPPLLRSATVKKHVAGYELFAELARDITPEVAAARLRECGGELYRNKLRREKETAGQ